MPLRQLNGGEPVDSLDSHAHFRTLRTDDRADAARSVLAEVPAKHGFMRGGFQKRGEAALQDS